MLPAGLGRGGGGEEERSFRRHLSSSEQGNRSERHSGRSTADSAQGEGQEAAVISRISHTQSPIFAGRRIVQRENGGSRRPISSKIYSNTVPVKEPASRTSETELRSTSRSSVVWNGASMGGSADLKSSSVGRDQNMVEMLNSRDFHGGMHEVVVVHGEKRGKTSSEAERSTSSEHLGSVESPASSTAEQSYSDDELHEILGQTMRKR
eukprot:751176-Hanusia_phi.AAC.4